METGTIIFLGVMIFLGIFYYRENKLRINRKIDSFLTIKKGVKKTFKKRLLFVSLLLTISSLIYFIYLTFPIILKENITGELKLIIMVLLLIMIAFGYLIIVCYIGTEIWEDFFLPIILFCIAYYHYDNYRVLSTAFIISIFFLYPFFTKKKRELKPNLWIMFTIIIMMLILFGGTLLIDRTYGFRSLSASLNIEGNQSTKYAGLEGHINCTSSTKKQLVGYNYSCSIYPPLNITKANVSFIDKTGKTKELEFDNLFFESLANTARIYFEIWGLNETNESIYISTARDYSFYTYEEAEKRFEKFVTYLIALIGIIFFSIPMMMYHFKELSK